MKKMFAAVLALTTTAMMFTSCGNKKQEDTTKTEELTTDTEVVEAVTTDDETTTAEETDTEPTAEEDSEAEEDDGEDVPDGKADIVKKVEGYDKKARRSTFRLEDQTADAWGSCFANDDYIDARSFARDQDLHITVTYEYIDYFKQQLESGETDLNKTAIMITPCHANGRAKFADTKGAVVTEYVNAADYPAYGTFNSENSEWVQVNGNDLATPASAKSAAEIEDKNARKTALVMPEVFVRTDGFIRVTNKEVKKIEFTIPAEEVNKMLDAIYGPPETDDEYSDNGYTDNGYSDYNDGYTDYNNGYTDYNNGYDNGYTDYNNGYTDNGYTDYGYGYGGLDEAIMAAAADYTGDWNNYGGDWNTYGDDYTADSTADSATDSITDSDADSSSETEPAAAAPAGWDGIFLQLGGNIYITKISIDQGNVFLNSTMNKSLS